MPTTRYWSMLPVLIATVLTAFLLFTACNGDDDNDVADVNETPTEQPEQPTPTPEGTPDVEPVETPEADEPVETPTPPPAPTLTPMPDDEGEDEQVEEVQVSSVLVYLVRGEEIGVAARDIPPTQQVATGALNELLTGTTGYEADLGLHSEIPMDTRLLAISIDNQVATVDLSSEFEEGGGSLSMMMRVAQVVFTLTQFDTVDAVEFQIEGQDVDSIGGEGILVDQPVTREDFEDVTPAILAESPTPGEVVSSPLRLSGTAMTFEATIQIEIVDNSGAIIYEDFATATVDEGFRGTFDLEIPFELTRDGFGSVIVFELSAEDGSRINIVEIPVDFRH